MTGRWVAQELPYKVSTACKSGSQSRLQACEASAAATSARHGHGRCIHSHYQALRRFWERCMTAILHAQPRNDTNPSEGRLLESSLVFSSPICGRQQGEINSTTGGVKALKDAVRLFPIPSWDSRAQAAGADTKQNLSCLFWIIYLQQRSKGNI